MNLPASVSFLFSKSYFRHVLWRRETIGAAFKYYGAAWVLVNSSSFFFPDVKTWASTHAGLLIFVVALFTLYDRWPVLAQRSRLAGRDVFIEIRVGDLLRASGDLVIATNTYFETDMASGQIAADSLQGQMTSGLFASCEELDQQLETALASEPHSVAPDGWRGKRKRYRPGTVARVRGKGRTVYLLAIADINEHGNVKATMEDVRSSLPRLWDFIARRGDVQPLAVPILGTGRSRVAEPCSVVAKEILKSFVAACAETRFCESMTLVIGTSDFVADRVDFGELSSFLEYQCRFADSRPDPFPTRGAASP